MENNFETVKEARQSWHTFKGWLKWYWIQNYLPQQKPAAICKEGDRYFIITHPDCVSYRERINQVVEYLYE